MNRDWRTFRIENDNRIVPLLCPAFVVLCVKKAERLITFMIISGPPVELPIELSTTLRRKGWQALRPGQIYALFWDSILTVDQANADRLMERVMEIHKVATQFGINHMFKTVKTSSADARYPEIL